VYLLLSERVNRFVSIIVYYITMYEFLYRFVDLSTKPCHLLNRRTLRHVGGQLMCSTVTDTLSISYR